MRKNKSFNIKYTISYKELLSFTKYSQRISKTIAYLFVIQFLLIFFILFNGSSKIQLLASCAGVLTVYFFYELRMRKKLKRSPVLVTEVDLEISNDCMIVLQENGKRIIPWNYVVKVKNLKEVLLIYYSTNMSIIIPRRVIGEKELNMIKDNFQKHGREKSSNKIQSILIGIYILITIFSSYFFIEQTSLNYLLFDDSTITVIQADRDKAFHYPYLLYIPKNCTGKNYLIIKPNASGREVYYHKDDLLDAKIMLKKWVAKTSKYDLNSPVLVPVFPRPEIPEGSELNPAALMFDDDDEIGDIEKREEEYKKMMKPYYDKQWSEGFDRQLYKMYMDARSYLEKNDVTIPKEEMILFGYAHGYSLSNIFSGKYQGEFKQICYEEPTVYESVAYDIFMSLHGDNKESENIDN
ncbi:YcxB family protein [Wukongibacter baidiensis]|uniref:YcxB family protein n=1 Tax=Wukongibacter baidiensis TaxID=1723361 RepID=UPI003D7FF1A1